MERLKIVSETEKKKYKTERVKIKRVRQRELKFRIERVNIQRVRQRERKDVMENEKY